jgi:ATP-binding cassette, subfamily B, bacterial
MAEDLLQDEDKFSRTLDFALWRRVLVFATPYLRLIATLCGLAFFTAFVDVSLPYLTGRIINEIVEHGEDARLAHYGVPYVSLFVSLALCIFCFIILCGRIATGVSYDIRKACFAKLQELPFSFYDRKAVGWLMARLTSDCGSLSHVMAWSILDIVWGATLITATSIMMLVLNWRLALVMLTIVPIMIFTSRFFQIRLLITNRLYRKANSHATAAFNEGISGVRTSKSLVREERNLAEFGELTGTMYGLAVKNALLGAVFWPAVMSICSLGVGLALWRGGVSVVSDTLTLGTLITFIQYATNLQGPVQEMANAITTVQGAQASAERVQTLLDTQVEIKDSAEVIARLAQHADRALLPGCAADGLPDRIETIEFRHVSFAYKEGRKVLEDFNLTVRAGETIALVGPTGGGKTTIVGLLCRFYEPTSGQVLINGVDYRQRGLRWLQSQLGIVLQQPHLFSGTIRENIRYGKLTASDAEVESAATLVNAHDFIAKMEKGYDSEVGEGGNKLSTGQKQLVAMARAILANPQVFVMDEATSSVDTHTERAIQAAVERVLCNRLSFVIAHRLSTIRSADRILVISGGRISEAGSHHELLQLGGHYYELYTSQFTHEHENEVLQYAPAATEE